MFDLEKLKNNNAVFWTFLLPDIRKVAADCGWAIGIHGLLSNDLDLMAMPWTEECASADNLANIIQSVVDNGGRPYIKTEGVKPHGRVVYTIYAGNSYIDLSIMKHG